MVRLCAALVLPISIGCGTAPAPGVAAASSNAVTAASPNALPSWNDGASKQAIVNFVARVTRDGGPDFVPVSERIATFDNDGTLWNISAAGEQGVLPILAMTHAGKLETRDGRPVLVKPPPDRVVR